MVVTTARFAQAGEGGWGFIIMDSGQSFWEAFPVP